MICSGRLVWDLDLLSFGLAPAISMICCLVYSPHTRGSLSSLIIYLQMEAQSLWNLTSIAPPTVPHKWPFACWIKTPFLRSCTELYLMPSGKANSLVLRFLYCLPVSLIILPWSLSWRICLRSRSPFSSLISGQINLIFYRWLTRCGGRMAPGLRIPEMSSRNLLGTSRSSSVPLPLSLGLDLVREAF